jgi:UDP-N-acetylglucosamine 2-epimerase (non-hydrolysing)
MKCYNPFVVGALDLILTSAGLYIEGGTMKNVMVVVGTRPEAVKMAPVIRALRASDALACQVVSTGQHDKLLHQTLAAFGIRPDIDLGLMKPAQTLSDLTAAILSGMTPVLREARPSIVLVQGDTTTVFATALAAFYLGIPVGHVEAGLRTHDLQSPWPEEMNRRATALTATLHFAPTEQARNHLLQEGIPAEKIHMVGNTVIDALFHTRDTLLADLEAPEKLSEAYETGQDIVLITGHRRENFGEGMAALCRGIGRLADEFKEAAFVYPVHPNPNVRAAVDAHLQGIGNVLLIPPLPYVHFIQLLCRSKLIITDSGGVQEEGAALGIPILVTRATCERREAVAAGVSKLIGSEEEAVVSHGRALLSDATAYAAQARPSHVFGDGHAAERIAGILREESL